APRPLPRDLAPSRPESAPIRAPGRARPPPAAAPSADLTSPGDRLMILYILRHGIAEDEAPKGDDRARPLTSRGRAKMRAGAEGMHALRLRFDVILTSPLVRAVETSAIVAEVFGGKPVPQELPALAAGIPPAETVHALRPFARHDHVVIVGH